MPRRSCKGTSKRTGQPCKAPALTDDDYCSAHSPNLPAEARFGSPEQAGTAARGVERKYPRLREVTERKLEEKADLIVDAGLEALRATRMTVSETGEVHIHPDYNVRLRASDTLLSRALGKPGQSMEIMSESRVLTLQLDARDPETMSSLHEFLRSRPAA